MSGGSFDYAYSRVDQFADNLGLRLDQHDTINEWHSKTYDFKPETREKLREIEHLARHVARFMREAEWLYSGDTGDATFMERVAEIEGSTCSQCRVRHFN